LEIQVLSLDRHKNVVFIKFRSWPWTDTKMWYLLNSGPGLGQTQKCGIHLFSPYKEIFSIPSTP
jgi:hypothetical protein